MLNVTALQLHLQSITKVEIELSDKLTIGVLLGLANVNVCRKPMKVKVVKWCWKNEMDIF